MNDNKQDSGFPSQPPRRRPLIDSKARYKTIHFDDLTVGASFFWLGEEFMKISETEARLIKANKIWDTFRGIEVSVEK